MVDRSRVPGFLVLVLMFPAMLPDCCVLAAPGANDPARRRSRAESSALHNAVKSGSRVEVERLLDEGADIDAKPFEMYSAPPLHFAALAGDLDIVRLLLDKGASVDSKELRHGSTALHVSASRGHIEVVQHLLQRGADINKKNNERGHTPLHEAARGGKVALVCYRLCACQTSCQPAAACRSVQNHIVAFCQVIQKWSAFL